MLNYKINANDKDKYDHKMSIDATALPSELLVTPQPLIGFSGLDVSRNSVHKSIWDAFNNNRKSDRVAIQFKLLSQNYEFPVCKPKRQSYEWYHPKGILKRNWMLKHLHVLPAVVVLFQDIEWNDSEWTEKQLQCASLVQLLKNSLQGRNTRLAVVLLQKSAPVQGEDLFASERAASLTTACDISAKMLFVLPHNDHLMGYTLRLESAFLEMAQSYYAQMSKQVRMHRDQLTGAHQTLRIRHQFKLGFIAEMRLDYNTALKHYAQAYSNLEEIRIVDTNCLEIKTISGFLNYKTCKLKFKLNAPRDAITLFKTHVDKYKSRVGFKELLFEHYAWLSVQYSSFAELFCEAIKNGLPALQTQHPGIYFHKAAEYIAKRKEAFLQCCSLSLSPTEPHTPNSVISPSSLFGEFFGIRAIKTGEPVTEQQIISLVQENERNFSHSAAIITLLGQAMAQFKVYKCLRFRKKLAIDMAEEYFKCGDHAKALTLYSLMLTDYRQDKWYTIFTEVLLKTLRSAYLATSPVDFISCSIEALSSKINCDQKDRIIVLENLWKVLQNAPPVSQMQIAPELRASWETSLAAFKSPVTIDLDKITEIIECVTSFERSQIKYDEPVVIKMYLRSLTDIPLKFRNISILLTDASQIFKLKAIKYHTFDSLENLRNAEKEGNPLNYLNMETEFKIEPGKCYKIMFSAEPHLFLENVELQVYRFEAEMGADRHYIIFTKSTNSNRYNKAFKNYNRKNFTDNLAISPACYIVPTFHLSSYNNQNMQPMLVNEFFKVINNISNPFNVNVTNVGISITVPNNLKDKVFLATDITSGKQKLLSHINIEIGEIQMQGCATVSYYVFSLVEGNLEFQQKLWYHLETNRVKGTHNKIINDESPSRDVPQIEKISRKISGNIQIDYIDDCTVRKLREDTIILACSPEFKFAGRFYTLDRQPLVKAFRGEDFLFRANIEVQALCELDILETYFICDHNLSQSPYSVKRKKHTKAYKKGENLEDVIMLRSNVTLSDWVTQKEYENQQPEDMWFKRFRKLAKPVTDIAPNKNPPPKISQSTTIIGSSTLVMSDSISSTNSITSDGGNSAPNDSNASQNKPVNKVIFKRAIDALQATGHCRGFIKGLPANEANQMPPIFGVYCIKWRRAGQTEENESKFVISGIQIDEPILNLYCTIEETMYAKVPMTLKITLKNSSRKIIYLIATLSNSEYFMCSGHKQLNVSIYAESEVELMYNLYPFKSGWQLLPEFSLEYNTQIDTAKGEVEHAELCQLVKRSMPKKVFILPPISNTSGRSRHTSFN